MWVGVRLLVVFAAPALEAAVLDGPVVAHLGELQIGEVLTDALVDLLVVVDAIRARRDEKREDQRRSGERREAPRVASIQASANLRHHDATEREAERQANLQRPELKTPQLFTELQDRGLQPQDQRDDDGEPSGCQEDPRASRRRRIECRRHQRQFPCARTRKEPIANASAPDRLKTSIASPGEHTSGSP